MTVGGGHRVLCHSRKSIFVCVCTTLSNFSWDDIGIWSGYCLRGRVSIKTLGCSQLLLLNNICDTAVGGFRCSFLMNMKFIATMKTHTMPRKLNYFCKSFHSLQFMIKIWLIWQERTIYCMMNECTKVVGSSVTKWGRMGTWFNLVHSPTL